MQIDPHALFSTLAQRWLGVFVVLFVLVAPLVARPLAVKADGSGAIIYNKDAGPYHVIIRANPDHPTVGSWHVTFFVTQPGPNGAAVNGVTVKLTAIPPAATSTPTAAANGPRGFTSVPCPYLNCQDVNVDLSVAGNWLFVMDIHGPLGDTSINFPDIVQPIDIGVWFWPAILVICVVLGIFYTTRRTWKPWFNRHIRRQAEEERKKLG